MIDWKRKLTSRKFWLAVAGLISGIVIACKGSAETAETITGIIMAAASVVGYLFAEGLTDSKGYQTPAQPEDEEVEDPEEEFRFNEE